MRRLVTLFLLTLFILALPSVALCYDIKATNPSVGTLSGGSTAVTFDITWKKSWRNANVIGNWDAAWVFVKFRTTTGGTIGDWKHASLNNSGHSVPSGATLTTGLVDTSSSFNIATNPVVGVFIYRSSDGAGTFTANNVALSWNYSQDGVSNSDTVEIRLFGIEMVYIPQGGFFAGDNATSNGSFMQGYSSEEDPDTDPWWIGSEDAISVTNSPGSGTGVRPEKAAEYYDPYDTAGYTLPAAFPKGYQAFYMMKGEIGQAQWVTFFNTLTPTQKSTRDITEVVLPCNNKCGDDLNYRNNVSWTDSGDATLPDQGGGATYEGVAMNYISWGDLTAYLDWAGLRPMSELEFERAGRGPQRAVSGEYAWGSTSTTQATSISNGGLPTERAQSGANMAYGDHASVQGPLRVGSFAYGVSTRIASGAGYYGVMELSGNVWERPVTVSNSTGRSFEGRYHGDGALNSSGDPNASTWPGNGEGMGWRGGSWRYSVTGGRLSDRSFAAGVTYRDSDSGGRGVRVAP
jgi:formylglycine-generating enzyme required for sulfatase activity